MKKKYIYLLVGVLILVLLDQIVKELVVKFISGNDLILINNFLKFSYVKNTGAAFSIFSGNLLFLIIVTIILISYLIYEYRKTNNKINLFAFILIFSGAIGNLIDRISLKYVRDFISFTIFNKDMAIFNVADMYITFGVILYIYCILRDEKNERDSSKWRR